jgi:membrane glycosyltransferase
MSSPDLPQAERSVETGAGGETRLRGAGPAPRPASFRLRRLALTGPTLAIAAILAALALAAYGLPETWLGCSVLGLFVVLMAWQSFTAWQYLYGLVAALMGDRVLSPLERRAATISTRPTGLSRTAAVVAIHAEDPIAVFSAIRVMARSLQREGGDGSDIDIFVLSDTREGAISAVEEHEFARIEAWSRREGRGMPRIRYRRRTENTGRKAGNIAEFCRTYGHEYDFMIVLDADSLMTGAAMRRLARLMEENPRTGLIQTVSYAAGRDTLFARIQQFAVRLYAPLSLRCLETWQGPDGSYWGHNAILRIEAFASNAELPVLSGRPPLGGEILCHDIVEGALLRRAGWEVRLLPEMGGTWEEMPTNLIDLLGRERRWCQGNLQHSRVLPMKGLLGASRWHLGVGILGYCVYPLWIAFLSLGTWQAARSGELGLIGYGIDGGNAAAAALAGLVIAVMALPKLLSLGYVLASPQRRADFGGTPLAARQRGARTGDLGPAVAGDGSVRRGGRGDDPVRARRALGCAGARRPQRAVGRGRPASERRDRGGRGAGGAARLFRKPLAGAVDGTGGPRAADEPGPERAHQQHPARPGLEGARPVPHRG